jgi:hypothetical protein
VKLSRKSIGKSSIIRDEKRTYRRDLWIFMNFSKSPMRGANISKYYTGAPKT